MFDPNKIIKNTTKKDLTFDSGSFHYRLIPGATIDLNSYKHPVTGREIGDVMVASFRNQLKKANSATNVQQEAQEALDEQLERILETLEPKCECGAEIANTTWHADWCPQYR